MQISGFYRVKKHPPHSKRGGCFFMFVKILNLMTLALQFAQNIFQRIWKAALCTKQDKFY